MKGLSEFFCYSHDTIYANTFLSYKKQLGWQESGDQGARSAPPSLCSSAPLRIPPWLRRVMVPSAPLRLPLPDISTRERSMFLSVLSHHRRPDLDPSHPTPCDASLLKKKSPVHHKHPPPLYSLPEEEGEREESALCQAQSWQRRADWRDIKRRNVPDVPLNFHNKVTPQLQATILIFPTILNVGKHFQFHVNLPYVQLLWEMYKSLCLHQSPSKYSETFCRGLKLNPSPWLYINVILSIKGI